MKKNESHTRRYIMAFILSAMIFLSGFLVNNFLTSKKFESLNNIENNISTNILSLETQFEILKEAPCETENNTLLTKQISELAESLDILERQGDNKERILEAKKRYSLLLVKDYLLSQKLSQECGVKPTFVIYFYKNAEDCPDCIKTGAALSALRLKYERLRVYAFDYNLDLPIIKTLASVYNVEPKLPAVVINKKTYYGLTTLEGIDALLPKEVKEPLATTTAATSTISTSTKSIKNK
jgi:thiol-disulfide isomerase/thioredoxin